MKHTILGLLEKKPGQEMRVEECAMSGMEFNNMCCCHRGSYGAWNASRESKGGGEK